MKTLGRTVVSTKFGEGVVTNVITKSTGYVEVTYSNGVVKKEMLFNLTDSLGNPCRRKPEKSTREVKVDRLQLLKGYILDISDWKLHGRCCTGYTLAMDLLTKIDNKAVAVGNEFISKIANSVVDRESASEKQAYCLARFAKENGI